jgi:hypothetical protein
MLPRLAANPSSGDVAVVYQSGGSVYGALVHGDGTVGAPAQLNSTTGGVQIPAVAYQPGAGYLAVWQAAGAANQAVFARPLDASLAPQGAESQVNEMPGVDATEPDVAFAAAAGKWIVVWTGTDGDGLGIRGRFLP